MKKQMSQLRAKVKFKHRGDWTPFHNQPWFLATPSCSSTKKLYSLVHSHTGSENGSQSLGVDLTGYPLSPRYWDPHMTCHWFVIGYRKYHKLWRLCSIVTSSVALVLWALCQINLEVVVPLWSRPWTKIVSFVKGLFWLVLLLVHKLTSHLLT